MPISRRKRALRWLQRKKEYEKVAVKSESEAKFVTEDLVEYVWLSPLGERFGDL